MTPKPDQTIDRKLFYKYKFIGLTLVRPMRARLAITIAIIAPARIHAQDLNALGKAYIVQATNVARQVLVAEFSKHPECIHHLSITFTFQVDARGGPHNVKIGSKTRDAWAVDTARRALSSAKYPPIPKQIVQTGSDMVSLEGDFSANAP